MSNQIERIVSMPAIPEESWRRTDPEMFFLPENEIVNAAGASDGSPYAGWTLKDSECSVSEIEAHLRSSGAVGCDIANWLAEGDYWKRVCLISVGEGTVSSLRAPGMEAQSVSVCLEKFTPSSVIPRSAISLATSQRLSYSVSDEIVVRVNAQSVDAEPIVVINQSSAQASQSYSVVKVVGEEQSRFSLVVLENVSGFSMRRHDVVLKKGAKATQLWLHSSVPQNNQTRALSEREVRLASDAEFFDAQIFAPQGTLRCISNVVMEGENAVAKSGVAAVASGNSRLDYEPWQEHRSPQSRTELKAKYLVSDSAKAVFQGLIRVEREAVQTVALQENKNLLVGKRSRVDAMPRLEILPNDVVCKHGSATGQLDVRHTYYLGTRGFSEEEARIMIVRGFVRDGLSALPFEHPLQGLADTLLTRVLSLVNLA
jgi:Fe-S cluster assembly scaffold protein SufB